jgi:iron complex outermembrane receptor protein
MVVAMAALPTSLAQEQESGDSGLQEIVVTAQKRGENLQVTPLTITALTAEIAAAKGVDGTADLQLVTPGLVFADSGIAPAIYLRGVGTQDTSAGQESSTPVYVDGVYYSDLPAGFTHFNNVERIEVVKGPQGTLFGRNATGGLIQVITRTPGREPEFNASVTAGNFEAYGARVYAATPIRESFAIDFAGDYYDQGEGWGTNRFNGRDVYDSTTIALRSKLVWTPGEATTATLAVDYGNREDSSGSGAIDRDALGAFLRQRFTGDFYDINTNLQPLEDATNEGASLKIEHDLAWGRFTSLTAYREYELESVFDQDRESINGIDVFIRDTDDQFTQELQVQSLPDSRIIWIAGVFYLDVKTDLTNFDLSGLALAMAGGFSFTPAQMDTESYAGYAQITLPVGAATKVTLGARYTRDERDIAATSITGAFGTNPVAIATPSKSWSEVTWRASVDHRFNDDLMVYASVSRGFKSGTYNMFSPATPPVDPELLDAYEIGLKSEFLGNRLRVNIAPFYYEYEDIQLSQAFQASTRLFNAAKATIQGVDLELVAKVSDGLMLDASVGYLDAEYDEFPNAPFTIPNPGVCDPAGIQPPVQTGPRTGGNRNCIFDASGTEMIRSPDVTFTLGARYEWDTSVGHFEANANYFHSGEFKYEPNGRLTQPSYGVLNAVLGWRDPSGKFGMRLWGRNLTDEEYFTNRISSVTDTFAAAAPLTYGITLDYDMN